MWFLTFWFWSTLITFIASRWAVKSLLKDDEDYFKNEAGMLAVMFFVPFIPILNVLLFFTVIIMIGVSYVQSVEINKFAKRIFLIRDKKKKKTKIDTTV
jgi:hypothetical protein